MIDIHAHVLHGLDDGPDCLANSLKYVKKAYEEGITTIFATPHAMDGVYQCTPIQILFKCSLLTQELEKMDIPVSIRPGSEISLTHDTVSLYDKGNLMTLNNMETHILLELPPLFMMQGIIHIINQCADRGVTVIIAHPERNTTILKNMSVVSDLISAGALMQTTATSLTGGFGKRIKRFSEKMISNDVVSFVASDIHPGRKFKMRDAYEKTCKLTSSKTAEKLFLKNPEEILYSYPQVVPNANSIYDTGSPGL